MIRHRVTIVAACLAGVLVGAATTLALRPGSASPERASDPVALGTSETPPSTYLIWVPRGLPAGFAGAVASVPKIAASTVVAEDDTWLRRSWNAAGEAVDVPPARYRIPIDTAAVDPATFAAFVPAIDRVLVTTLDGGEAILGATSASLRNLDVGSVLDVGGRRLHVTAVLPDEVLGAAELVVSRRTGASIGVTHDRYLLVRPDEGRRLTASAFRRRIFSFLPASLGIDREVQVRAPGDTPYFRAGDAVLPPVIVKRLFGEFAARPGTTPGTIRVDPAWVDAHVVTTTIPLLGRVTCNRGILDQLRRAMRRVQAAGLAASVHAYRGCFVPRHIGWDEANMLSYHSWGIAFDVGTDLRGQTPRQDARFVRILRRWGFTWGGTWIVPDGNHFEFHRTA